MDLSNFYSLYSTVGEVVLAASIAGVAANRAVKSKRGFLRTFVEAINLLALNARKPN